MKDRYRTDLFVQHLYKDYPGKLRFDPKKIQTREAFFAWKQQVREKAYELMSKIIEHAMEMVGGCKCKDGCAACVACLGQ